MLHKQFSVGINYFHAAKPIFFQRNLFISLQKTHMRPIRNRQSQTIIKLCYMIVAVEGFNLEYGTLEIVYLEFNLETRF